MARTGKWFAYQHAGIKPGRRTPRQGTGKRISDRRMPGERRGACLQPGSMARLLAVILWPALQRWPRSRFIEDEGLATRAGKLGNITREGIGAKLAGVAGIKDIRGKGLMIGIELDRPAAIWSSAASRPAC